MLVGEDVVIRGLDGWDELDGAYAEAILYDYHEQLYTVVLPGNGRRLQARVANLTKSTGRRAKK